MRRFRDLPDGEVVAHLIQHFAYRIQDFFAQRDIALKPDIRPAKARSGMYQAPLIGLHADDAIQA